MNLYWCAEKRLIRIHLNSDQLRDTRFSSLASFVHSFIYSHSRLSERSASSVLRDSRRHGLNESVWICHKHLRVGRSKNAICTHLRHFCNKGRETAKCFPVLQKTLSRLKRSRLSCPKFRASWLLCPSCTAVLFTPSLTDSTVQSTWTNHGSTFVIHEAYNFRSNALIDFNYSSHWNWSLIWIN